MADLGNIPDWLKIVGGTGIGAPLIGVLKFLWGNKVRADNCPYCEKNNEWHYAGGLARGFGILVGILGALVTMGSAIGALLELADLETLIFVGVCALMIEFAAFRLAKQQRIAWKCTVCGYEQPIPGAEREARAYEAERRASLREATNLQGVSAIAVRAAHVHVGVDHELSTENFVRLLAQPRNHDGAPFRG